jgi:hypothetical protein
LYSLYRLSPRWIFLIVITNRAPAHTAVAQATKYMQYKISSGFAALLLTLVAVGCKDDVDARVKEVLAAKAKEEAQQKLMSDVTQLRAEAEARAKKDAAEKLETEANSKAQAAVAAQKEKSDKARTEAELKEKNAAALEAEAKKKLAEAEANRNDLEARKIADKARADADFARRIAIAGEEENLRLRRELLLLEQRLASGGVPSSPIIPSPPIINPALLPVPGSPLPPGSSLISRGPAGTGGWVRAAASGARMYIRGNSIPADTVFQIKDAPRLPVAAGPVVFCAVECQPSPFTFIPPGTATVQIPLPRFTRPGSRINVYRFDPARNEYVPWTPMKTATVLASGRVAQAEIEHFTIIGLGDEGAPPPNTPDEPPPSAKPAGTQPSDAPPEPLDLDIPADAPRDAAPLPLDPKMPDEAPAPVAPVPAEEAPPAPLDPENPDRPVRRPLPSVAPQPQIQE